MEQLRLGFQPGGSDHGRVNSLFTSADQRQSERWDGTKSTIRNSD